MRLLRYLSLALVCLLAGCGDLPRPFAGNPGSNAQRLLQPPPARLIVQQPKDALLAEPASALLASNLAAALADQGVPALAIPPSPGDWRLVISAQVQGADVIPLYTLFDGADVQQGIAQGQPVSADGWRAGGAAMLHLAATGVAPGIADLLTRIEAAERAQDPNSLLNRQARIAVPDVTGAPGDGNRQLARQLRLHLADLGLVVQDAVGTGASDFKVAGMVTAVPIAGQMTRIEIQWVVSDAANAERGRIVQLNEIPAGSLDLYWGDVAVVVAQEAATGVRDVIAQQTGTKPK